VTRAWVSLLIDKEPEPSTGVETSQRSRFCKTSRASSSESLELLVVVLVGHEDVCQTGEGGLARPLAVELDYDGQSAEKASAVVVGAARGAIQEVTSDEPAGRALLDALDGVLDGDDLGRGSARVIEGKDELGGRSLGLADSLRKVV
jgi:hypothetical protein